MSMKEFWCHILISILVDICLRRCYWKWKSSPGRPLFFQDQFQPSDFRQVRPSHPWPRPCPPLPAKNSSPAGNHPQSARCPSPADVCKTLWHPVMTACFKQRHLPGAVFFLSGIVDNDLGSIRSWTWRLTVGTSKEVCSAHTFKESI